MALSNAERQRRYRERAFKDPGGHRLVRLALSLAPDPAAALKRLVLGYGITQRELIERLLLAEDTAVWRRLDPTARGCYLDGKLPAGALPHNGTGSDPAHSPIGEPPESLPHNAEADAGDPPTAQARAAELRAAGRSFRDIAAALDAEGYRTRSGQGRWHPGSVADLLK